MSLTVKQLKELIAHKDERGYLSEDYKFEAVLGQIQVLVVT